MNVSVIKEIIVAVVSNPNFFMPSNSSSDKIKQVCDLIKEVDNTVK